MSRATPRPSHRTVTIWKDVRAAINHIDQAQFQLGYLPAKPQRMDPEVLELQLADARIVLEQLAQQLEQEGASA